MKIHASMNGLSSNAMSKLGCELHQTNWQEGVKLPSDIFACRRADCGVTSWRERVHAMSAEGDAEFNAEDEIERCSEEFYL